jgi:5'-nucleotidase
MRENLYLYFTSDLHSHFENWPKIIHYINDKCKRHREKGEAYFLLDNGDHLDRFHPITEAYLGKANIDLLNAGGFRAVTIGNNEGITLPRQSFYELYDEARFDVTCANLFPIEDEKPNWLKPYTYLKTPSGITIGLIGLTAPFNAFYKKIGWNVENPFDTLDKILPVVKAESDIVVLLSHLGINEDEIIAKQYPDIDIVIGGHTHHLFKQGEHIDGTLLGAVGKHGFYVGDIQLVWNHETKILEEKHAYAIDLKNEGNDDQTKQLLHQWQRKADKILSEEICTVDHDYEVDWFRETTLISDLTEMLLEWTKADCAMLNAGILLEGLKKGAVTKADIHRICPHPINPVTVSINGEHLLEMIRMVHTKRFIEFPLKGFGFRGEILGRMVFSNIEVTTRKDKEDVEHVESVTVNGKPLDLDHTYKLATADMFTFGKLLPAVSGAKHKHYFMPEFMRDLLATTIGQMNRKK